MPRRRFALAAGLALAAWLGAALYVGVLFVHLNPRCFPDAVAGAADRLVLADENTLLLLDEIFHAAAERLELALGGGAVSPLACMTPRPVPVGSCSLWGCFAGAYPCPYLD